MIIGCWLVAVDLFWPASGRLGSTDKQIGTCRWVDLVWHIEFLAGVHHNWGNGRIVGVANARKQVMHHL